MSGDSTGGYGAMRWWQTRRKRHCPHVVVIGIYGDQINNTPGGRRLRCAACRRLLDGPVSISYARANADSAEPQP